VQIFRDRLLSEIEALTVLYVFGVLVWLASLALFGGPILVTFLGICFDALGDGFGQRNWFTVSDGACALLIQSGFTFPVMAVAFRRFVLGRRPTVANAT
jgi:hypothetical protein